MQDPICELVIGNIPGAREVNVPGPNWISQLAQAAVTRAQTKCNKDDIKPLRVSSDISKVTVQELEEAQKEYVSLQRL